MTLSITKYQQDIINESEPKARSKLQSFALYLNLPWDQDLETFSKAVIGVESQFKDEIDALNSSTSPSDHYLAHYPYHLFYFPQSQCPEKMIQALNLDINVANVATKLLNIWFKRDGIDPLKVGDFMKEVSGRILNLNFLFPRRTPEVLKGAKTNQSKHLKLTPHFQNMEFESVSTDEMGYFNNRFEIFYVYLNPTILFGSSFNTLPFEINKILRFTPETESDIERKVANLIEYVKDIMHNVSFPSIENYDNFKLDITQNKNLDPVFYNESSNATDMSAVSQISTINTVRTQARPDIILRIKTDGKQVANPHSLSTRSIFFPVEIKYQSNLSSLCRKFFVPIESTSGIASTSKWRQRVQPNALGTEVLSRFQSFISQTISYSKSNGTRLVLLCNMDDVIILKSKDFYPIILSSMGDDADNLELFSKWEVSSIKCDSEQPILLTLFTLILEEWKASIKYGAVKNYQVSNWHLTFGSHEITKTHDRLRLLLMRKLFYHTLYSRVVNHGESRVNFNFNWNQDELDAVYVQGPASETSSEYLNALSDDISNTVKALRVWHLLTDERIPTAGGSILEHRAIISPLGQLKVFESTRFRVFNRLQNQVNNRHISATTMDAVLMDGSQTHNAGVLKIYDINRMRFSNDLGKVIFRNGVEIEVSLKNVLVLSFEFFIHEVMIYESIVNEDFIPRLIEYGFVTIAKLDPDSLTSKPNIYENPFYGSQGSELKSESLYLFMEKIQQVSLEEMKNINFDELKKQSLVDIASIHTRGIVHCDLSARNIIIKKSIKSPIGYRVVFIDFGQSLMVSEKEHKFPDQLSNEEQMEKDKSDLIDAIEHYRKLVLNR